MGSGSSRDYPPTPRRISLSNSPITQRPRIKQQKPPRPNNGYYQEQRSWQQEEEQQYIRKRYNASNL